MDDAPAASQPAELIRAAREALGINTAELAHQLGMKPETLLAWLVPAKSQKSRGMPEAARLMLERLVEESRAKRGARWLGRR